MPVTQVCVTAAQLRPQSHCESDRAGPCLCQPRWACNRGHAWRRQSHRGCDGVVPGSVSHIRGVTGAVRTGVSHTGGVMWAVLLTLGV